MKQRRAPKQMTMGPVHNTKGLSDYGLDFTICPDIDDATYQNSRVSSISSTLSCTYSSASSGFLCTYDVRRVRSCTQLTLTRFVALFWQARSCFASGVQWIPFALCRHRVLVLHIVRRSRLIPGIPVLTVPNQMPKLPRRGPQLH